MPAIWNDLGAWLSERRPRISYFRFHVNLLLALVPVGIFIALTNQDWLVYPVVLVLSLLSAGAIAQRSRDCNYPGWLAFGPFLVDWAVTVATGMNWAVLSDWLIVPAGLGKLFVVALFFIPGTRGPNRYGPDPLAPAEPAPD